LTRKGSGLPYSGHLLSVASLVIEAGGTEMQALEELISADRTAARQ
jgi:hypothetical protein